MCHCARLFLGPGDSNSHSHTCTINTSPTEPSLQLPHEASWCRHLFWMGSLCSVYSLIQAWQEKKIDVCGKESTHPQGKKEIPDLGKIVKPQKLSLRVGMQGCFLWSSQKIQQQIAHECLIHDQVCLTLPPKHLRYYSRKLWETGVSSSSCLTLPQGEKPKTTALSVWQSLGFIWSGIPLWPSEKLWHSLTAALIKYYYSGASLTIGRGEKGGSYIAQRRSSNQMVCSLKRTSILWI